MLYPSLNSKTFDPTKIPARPMGIFRSRDFTFTILSINRYERKKNLPLALKTLGKILIFQPNFVQDYNLSSS